MNNESPRIPAHFHKIQFVLAGIILLFVTPLHASVKLKVSASNPSPFQEQVVPVKSYLPKGIGPQDIINAGGLTIGYDIRKGQYYVYKEVVLAPKEMAVYQVEINDIWLISEADLEKQRAYINKLTDRLKNSQYAKSVQKLIGEIDESITIIINHQNENLIEKVSAVDHIAAYELNTETLKKIKEDIDIIESMVMTLSKTGAVVGVSQDQAAQACLAQEAMRYADIKGIALETPQDVRFTIDVQNSSDVDTQNVPLRYYLAQEVGANDILDSAGLNVGFDFEKAVHYLFQDSILLGPGEKKIFDITLRNKWVIDKLYLLTLKVNSDNVALALGSRAGFEKFRQRNDEIQSQLDQLLKAKSFTELTEEHIRTFRNNHQQLKNIEQEIAKLENMVITSNGAGVVTAQARERLCEEKRDQKIIAAAKGPEIIKEFKMAAGTIFKGKSLKTTTTWELIIGIIIFLGFLSSAFYYMQIREQKVVMLDPLTGAFSRAYILERFREELRISQNTGTKCSLLVMDIDKFKSINDTYGHAVGDTILKEFVITIRKGLRATDLVGRYGGDEFLIILPTSNKERAHKIGEGIAKIVQKSVIQIEKQTFKITTSIGTATYPDDSKVPEDVFLKADGAMYQTKRRGGNGVSTA